MNREPPEIRMSYLKSKLPLPLLKHSAWLKYAVIGACALLWIAALVGEFYSSAGTMKYLLMSLIMLAIAAI
jgi:alkylhydroperoxidase family enzyme